MKPISQTRAVFLSFLTAYVTLSTQVLVHRIVSAKLLNNYAFLVISLTMLGFAVSGVLLCRFLPVFLRKFNQAVTLCASFFCLTLLGITVVFYRMPVGTQHLVNRSVFLEKFLSYMPLALLYALPFALCGFILGALLSSRELKTGQIYCADLLGSAVGALLILTLISRVGVEISLLLVSLLFLVGSFILFPPPTRFLKMLSGVALILMVFAFLSQEKLFHFNYPEESMLAQSNRFELEKTEWDPVARIEMSRVKIGFKPDRFSYPCLIGSNDDFIASMKRVLTQNNYAFTFAPEFRGERDSLQGINETMYAAGYEASVVANPRVMVIGVGGGIDILTGLFYNAREIIGVEVNQATLNMLTRHYEDYFTSWVTDPRVKLEHGEGRYYLSKKQAQFDIIQLSGVDTYSGTAGSAHVFSENYLYTREAMELYFSRLTSRGIINLMRLEFVPPREMLRALVTMVEALRNRGIKHPVQHIMMVSANKLNFTAMLVKKTPFTPEEINKLVTWSNNNDYLHLSAGPLFTGNLLTEYQKFLVLDNQKAENAFIQGYPFDISPVVDNRPFFFKYSRWNHLFAENPLIKASIPVMEYSLIILFLLVSMAALICVYAPLRLLAKISDKPSGTWRFAMLFGAAGIGYMAVEIALLQKFGLFLGHPNRALSVVLASMLCASGIGALFSPRVVSLLKNLRYVAYSFAFLVLVLYFLVFPHLLQFNSQPLPVKAVVSFLVIFFPAFLLGIFLPVGIESLKSRGLNQYIPWAWGINGIFSVLAPVLSVGFSMSWGINALFLLSIPIYLIAGFAYPDK